MKVDRQGQAAIIAPKVEERILQVMANGPNRLRDQAMLLFMLYTGVRRNEARLLNIGDLVGPAREIRDEFLLLKGITKNHQARKLFVNAKVKRALSDYLATRPNARINEPLFITRSRARFSLSGFSRIFEKAFAAAGFEGGSTHSMRRSCFTRLARNGVRPRVIQEIAGHGSFAVTALYIEVSEEESKEALLAL